MDSIYKKMEEIDLGEIGLTAEMIGVNESSDKVDRSVFEQVLWERDVALNQLKELGYGLGEKPKTGHWIHLRVDMYECSECGCIHTSFEIGKCDANYCPNCGSKNVEVSE